MKKNIFIFLFISLSMLQLSYGQGLNFIDLMPATGTYSFINASAVDASGNVYVVGTFNGNIAFDATHPSGQSADDDIWLAKYNSSGILIWADALIGGGDGDVGSGIVLDANGTNLYITGRFDGPYSFSRSVTFNAGAFVARFSCSTGAFVNGISIPGAFDGQSIAFSNIGYYYPNGSLPTGVVWFSGTTGISSTVTFPRQTILSGTVTIAGNRALYMAAYSPDLSVICGAANVPGTTGGTTKITSYGNTAYMTGNFTGSLTNLATQGSWLANNGGAFLASFTYNDNSVRFICGQTYQVPGHYNDRGNAIVLDNTHAAYITGSVNGGFFLSQYTGTSLSFTQGWNINIPSASGTSVSCDGTNLYVAGVYTASGNDYDPLNNLGRYPLTLSKGSLVDFFLGEYRAKDGFSEVNGLWLHSLSMSLSTGFPIIQNYTIPSTSVKKIVLAGSFYGTGPFTRCSNPPSLSSNMKTTAFIGGYNADDTNIIPPVISGAADVCQSGSIFSVSGYPLSCQVNWTATSPISPTSGTGSTVTLYDPGNAVTQGTIVFTSTGYGCGALPAVSESVKIGVPTLPMPSGPAQGCTHDADSYNFSAVNIPGVTTAWNWTVIGNDAEITSGQGSPIINIDFLQLGNYAIECDYTTPCGIVQTFANFSAQCGNGNDAIKAFPNPANDQMTITVSSNQTKSNSASSSSSQSNILTPPNIQKYDAVLLNSAGTVVKSGNTTNGTMSILTGDLPLGNYVLKVLIGQDVLLTHVIVSH